MSHASQRIYDPVKAHDYYIRTRKLKGRRPAMAKLSTTKGQKGKVTTAPTKKQAIAKAGAQDSVRPVTITEQRQKEVQARVAVLKTKLATLNNLLQKLVKEAIAQGDNPPATKKTKSVAKKSSTAGTKDRKALTGSQKREKARKARVQYRKDHPLSAKQARKQKIEEVKKKIEEVKTKLQETIALGRAISKQQSATNN